ncbi:hypothetical protein [Ammoniphilus sp. 3BR4]|uniref:hypothetical protein n=1 Tax=Ammoniphilus sp. 3BR4 TaxID=3158265 RepID=UPI0034650A53
MTERGMKRGQPITFRIPSDTPDHILKYLQQLKNTERRNFSSKIAEFVMSGVSGSISKHRETITIPLPKGLSKAQRDWLKHEHSEALLGSIVYQLLTNPVRTSSLFASLNSSALEIEEALYLQGETAFSKELKTDRELIDDSSTISEESEPLEQYTINRIEDDDLDDFNWETAKKVQTSPLEEEKAEDLEDLLGDFLAQMNK